MRRIKNKNFSITDWHKADIKAALEKEGWSLRRLSLFIGVNEAYVKRALYFPFPKYEKVIADTLGLTPRAIWPSRFDEDGNRVHKKPGRKPKMRVVKK